MRRALVFLGVLALIAAASLMRPPEIPRESLAIGFAVSGVAFFVIAMIIHIIRNRERA